MGSACEPSVVLWQGDDFGDATAWFHWWLDDADAGPVVGSSFWPDLSPLITELDAALPTPGPQESLETAISRALAGALADPARERDLMTRLGAVLLDASLVESARKRIAQGKDVEFRVTPAQRLVHVPWALLVPPWGGEEPAPRWGELVTVVDDVPASFHVGRPRVAADTDTGPVIRIVDPALRSGERLFSDTQRDSLAGAEDFPPGAKVDAAMLSARLKAAPAPRALAFVGHVTGGLVGGGSTSLVLSAAANSDGLPRGAAAGWLSAGDLVTGSMDDGGLTGAELWPLPARVAIVACNSGSDLGRREPFGLVIACLNAGARWTIATRWVLPADRAMRSEEEPTATDPEPLAEISRAVIAALQDTDPAVAVARALRARIRAWDALPVGTSPLARLAASPLTWGALAVFRADERRAEVIDLG